MKLGKEESLPGFGLKLRVFVDSIPQPIPQPTRMIRRTTPDAPVVSVYPGDALWRSRQTVGCFRAPGLVLYLCNPNLPRSCCVSGFVSENEFSELVTRASEEKSDSEDTPEIWVAQFLGVRSVKSPDAPVIKKSLPFDVRWFFSEGDVRYVCAFLSHKKDKRNAVLIWASDCSEPLEKSLAAFAQVVASVQFTAPKAADDNLRPKRNPARQSDDPDIREALRASREAAAAQVRNLKDWWVREETHYVVLSNQKKRTEIDALCKEIERVRAVYDRIAPTLKPIREVCVIRVFQERREYLEYVGEGFQWTGGIWVPGRKELVVSPTASHARAKDRKNAMTRILYHELFHQYVYYAGRERNPHTWFNEGLAQYFEDLEIKTDLLKSSVIPEKNDYEKGARAAKGKYGKITLLRDMTTAEFQSDSTETYPAVWSLMYFLRQGLPVMKNTDGFSGIPGRYYRAFLETGSPDRANHAAWNAVDLEALERLYQEFWSSRALFNKSRTGVRLEPLFSVEKP